MRPFTRSSVLSIEPLESRLVLDCALMEAICIVNVNHDDPPLDPPIKDLETTLREAVLAANASEIINEIRFEFAGNATIQLDPKLGPLEVTRAVVIDGTNLFVGKTEVALPPVKVAFTGDRVWNLAVAGESPADGSNEVVILDMEILGSDVPGAPGGGIEVGEFTSLTLDRVTISGGLVDGVEGGGAILNYGMTTVNHSTLSGNTSTTNGGAIANYGTLLLYNSTISGNAAESGAGGGLFTYGGLSTQILSTTITGNFAQGAGGGIFAGGLVMLQNSIVSGNQSGVLPLPAGPDISDPNTFVAASFSLVQSPNGHMIMTGMDGNIVGMDAQLGVLSDNGGPTQTHLPIFDPPMVVSPAIDAGDPLVMGGTDQRGFARVVNGRVDMGSVEFGAMMLPDGDFNGDTQFTIHDIDLMVAEIAAGTNNPLFDLNGDGQVDINDLAQWLAIAGSQNLGFGKSFLPGDADLDGNVDASDFIVWNEFKFGPGGAWSRGDFNADGSTDGSDFLIWFNHRFMSSNGTQIGTPSLATVVSADSIAASSVRDCVSPMPMNKDPFSLESTVSPAVTWEPLATSSRPTSLTPRARTLGHDALSANRIDAVHRLPADSWGSLPAAG